MTAQRLKRLMQRTMRYAAAPGAGYTNEQAQVIGSELEAMSSAGVSVTPPNIVDRARPDDAPLHPHFQWSDPEAAELYRRWQARSLVNHLIIVTPAKTGEQQRKAHFSVMVEQAETEDDVQEDGREYVHVYRVESDEELRSQVNQRAWAELRSWAQRWEPFQFPDLMAIIATVPQK